MFLLPAATKLGQGNIFTSVCLSMGGGVSASVHAGIPIPPDQAHAPQEQTPLQTRHTTPRPGTPPPRSRHPPEQTPPRSRHPLEQTPPWSRHPLEQTPPPRSRLQHMVNERLVHILLECILVNESRLRNSLQRNAISVADQGFP